MNTHVTKPHAPACERNRDPILAVLHDWFAPCGKVLEIGSGTGQHAVYFAGALPHLTWQASDRADNIPGITAWLAEAKLANTPPALALDVNGPWPPGPFDAIFSAHTLHIMAWPDVEANFAALPAVMAPACTLVIYGPFNYGGQYTSESNADFDEWLKARGAHQGIRDFAAVDALARRIGLELQEDRAMPANNRCLVWRRVA